MNWSRVGAVLGFVGVLLGAFGAHGLHSQLEASGRVDTWEKAVFYHMIHAVVLLVISSVHPQPPRKAAWWLFIGILLFSGSLYALCLTGVKMLGAVTPFGGVAFLVGWAALFLNRSGAKA
jgi:uncharacterized membrane protein YgdD (TMEM256/DUF423 family)